MRYRVEQFLAGDWTCMTDSDDYLVASDAERVLVYAGAKSVRVVDTARDAETSDPVILLWLTT